MPSSSKTADKENDRREPALSPPEPPPRRLSLADDLTPGANATIGTFAATNIETYARDTTKSGPRFACPIGLEGLYRKGELTYQGADNPFFGGPLRVRAVNAVKGTWVDDHTFVVDWRVLGLANSPVERWTLTFEAEKLDLRVKFGSFGVGSELSVEGEAGG